MSQTTVSMPAVDLNKILSVWAGNNIVRSKWLPITSSVRKEIINTSASICQDLCIRGLNELFERKNRGTCQFLFWRAAAIEWMLFGKPLFVRELLDSIDSSLFSKNVVLSFWDRERVPCRYSIVIYGEDGTSHTTEFGRGDVGEDIQPRPWVWSLELWDMLKSQLYSRLLRGETQSTIELGSLSFVISIPF